MSTGFEYPTLDQIASYRGLYGGAREPRPPMDFNFGGGGGIMSLLAPFIQPMINQIFGQGGIMPAQFSPSQSLYDQFQGKEYAAARSAAMQTASAADRETYVRMIKGIADAKHTQWGLEQQRSANIMAGDLAYMAPIMAQTFPEIFDEAHGTRGSATVMASFLHRAGRTAIDPVTGYTGMSGDSAGVLAAEMHKRFFGANADLSGWRGMRAGAAGTCMRNFRNMAWRARRSVP